MTIWDVFTLFFTVFAAVTLSLVFVSKTILQSASRKAGYNFMRGRSEYVDKQEEQYRRKRV